MFDNVQVTEYNIISLRFYLGTREFYLGDRGTGAPSDYFYYYTHSLLRLGYAVLRYSAARGVTTKISPRPSTLSPP